MFARTMLKAPIRMHTRAFSGKTYKEKTFKQAWLSDSGAYPVMSVIVGAFLFAVGAGVFFMITGPDARLMPSNRKSMLRGELKNVE